MGGGYITFFTVDALGALFALTIVTVFALFAGCAILAGVAATESSYNKTTLTLKPGLKENWSSTYLGKVFQLREKYK